MRRKRRFCGGASSCPELFVTRWDRGAGICVHMLAKPYLGSKIASRWLSDGFLQGWWDMHTLGC
eukprot:9301632-Prorocentrum_lima.AAC.1